MSHKNQSKQNGVQTLLRELSGIWESRNACKVLQALVHGGKSQRTLQREMQMKASVVNEAVGFLERNGYVRTWTENARRDKLYAISLRGVHLAFLIAELAEKNELSEILEAGRGGHRA